MHQSTRLIEVGQRERNAELYRAEPYAFFQDRIFRIEHTNGFATGGIVGAFQQGVGHFVKNEILNRHLVRRCLWPLDPTFRRMRPTKFVCSARGFLFRNVSTGRLVVIQAPDIDRIASNREGNMIQHALDPNHPLRPAKSTEGRV